MTSCSFTLRRAEEVSTWRVTGTSPSYNWSPASRHDLDFDLDKGSRAYMESEPLGPRIKHYREAFVLHNSSAQCIIIIFGWRSSKGAVSARAISHQNPWVDIVKIRPDQDIHNDLANTWYVPGRSVSRKRRMSLSNWEYLTASIGTRNTCGEQFLTVDVWVKSCHPTVILRGMVGKARALVFPPLRVGLDGSRSAMWPEQRML